jgi:hypothetical protein
MAVFSGPAVRAECRSESGYLAYGALQADSYPQGLPDPEPDFARVTASDPNTLAVC